MRLINVAPMLEQFDLEYYDKDWYVNQYNADWISSWLESQPVIDAEPVKHGRWEDGPLNGYLRCSVCKDVYIDDTWLDDGKWNYCPNCGSKMDLEGNE